MSARSSRWARLKRAVLKGEPRCRVCALADVETPAVLAQPIVPLDQGGERHRRNLQPVCAGHVREAGAIDPVKVRLMRKRLRAEFETRARMKR